MSTSPASDPGAVLLHETAQRIRLRCPLAVSPTDLRVQLERLPGVSTVRVTAAIRSATVHYDGRRSTRTAILGLVTRMARQRVRAEPRAGSRPRGRAGILHTVPALAAAVTPLAPSASRPALALGALAARTLARPPQERHTAANLLDTLSLATIALTGHPVTAMASILLGRVAEVWRDQLLDDADRLLEHLTPPVDPDYPATRDGGSRRVDARELRPGDVVTLKSGQVVPADGLVRSGRARLFPRTHVESPEGRPVRAGNRLASGERLLDGQVTYVVERPASQSQARRMRDHVRHTLHTQEALGRLTPDLDRLVALPLTAAGLVLAMTGDASRTAAMLQADPQHGLQLSHPVAREAALYALARQGMLGNGLETVERLATATVLAVEDLRIVTERNWRVAEVRSSVPRLSRRRLSAWLARLSGIEPAEAESAGFRDRQVAAWLEHGAVLHDPPQVLHVAGAEPLRRSWGLELTHPDRGSLERVLGIVEGGRLLGSVKLKVRLRPRVAKHFAELRRHGFRRIAILTEDLEERAGPELESLGADVVLSSSREAQGRWLEQAVEGGERIALLHTGLRDLLPPGGLSLCPVEADAGAHAVLLGEPLLSLIAARSVAMRVYRNMRRQFGATMGINGALMVASGLRLIPPIASASLHHASALALLRWSMSLARVGATGTGAMGRLTDVDVAEDT
jgi:cation transport ATPase